MAEMTPTRKRIAMLIVVVGGALLAERMVTLMSDDNEIVEPSAGQRTRPRANVTASDAGAESTSALTVQIERLDARQRALSERSEAVALPATGSAALFDAISWQRVGPIAPPSNAAPSPPPPPVAPAFPYAYLGGLLEDGVRTTFFTKGDRVLPVKTGDTVDAVYRVDQMNEKQMTLTYLPLNQSQTVALGSAR